MKTKNISERGKRHRRIRKKVFGTKEKPRLNVYRSLTNFYAQLINDTSGKVLLGLSTLDASFEKEYKIKGNKKAAEALGKMFARKALEAKIKECVFDRGGYLYHGRIKAFAEGAREGGLKF